MTRLLTIAMMVAMAAIPAVAQFSENSGNNSNSAQAEKENPAYRWQSQGVTRGTNSESYSGDTTAGPTWDRPFASGTCCSGNNPNAYDTEIFYVSQTGFYDINSVQNGFDGFLFVYQEDFDPANQEVNFVAGNDDGAGGIGTSDIDGVELQANTVYIIVTTGFAPGDEGPYTNTITGPGNIVIGSAPVLVPTLGEWGLIAFVIMLAGAAVLYSRKNRMQTA